ncbi:aspartate aminotransferase family protein [candidate division WOR-3 bacterium]|nr:aspartate aminotransferase family protein [candidate division WOR-3 bacterium]
MPFFSSLYRPFDFKVSYARGNYIYDENENAYLDAFSGIGVNIFGHRDEGIFKAITTKLERFGHISNLIKDEDAERAAEAIGRRFDVSSKVIFANSGTEAVEAALKILKKNNPQGLIVSFTGSFHGRSAGSLSLTGIESMKKQFQPLLPNTVTLPFNEASVFCEFCKKNKVAGVFFEAIQGSGGIVPLKDDLSHEITIAQKDYGIAVVADEVQSGLGRTGSFFAYENFGVNPDIVILGKALGGGIPLAAVIAKNPFGQVLKQGEHGSTFAPNPAALSACLEILSRLTPELILRNKARGEYFFKSLKSFLPLTCQVRGRGLMIGIQTDKDANSLKKFCFKEKILINTIGDRIIRLLPPFTITEKEIDRICMCLSKAVEQAPFLIPGK